mgnify:FL=1
MPFCPTRRDFVLGTVVGVSSLVDFSQRGALAAPFATTNEIILRAREAGLRLLAPTPAELQKGLELHADATVFDAYGFAPRAAVDGTALKSAIEGGATDQEMTD